MTVIQDEDHSKPITQDTRDHVTTDIIETGFFKNLNPAAKNVLKTEKDGFDTVIKTHVEGVPNLSLRLPDGTVQTFEAQKTITLGRSDRQGKVNPSLDLAEYKGRVHGVSRVHAKMIYRENQFHLMDLNSSNGSKINSDPVTPHMPTPLHVGDDIQLGKLHVIVETITLRNT